MLFCFLAPAVGSLLYLSALGLCGGPDVPHVALECRTDLAEGNDVGVTKVPPVSVKSLLNDSNNTIRKSTLPATANLTFKISPVAGLVVSWETTLVKDTLYVELPAGILPEGSKESLVTLLEYAEEKLNCKHVVMCFNKNRSDRVSLLRVFNFFGFQILPPSHPLVVSPAQDLLFMAYTIEKDSDSESESSSDEDEARRDRRTKRLSSSEGSEEGSCSDG
ncbi:hypothetical protein Btru_044291 [Bulinus truncatus]|nr:hypothetical protein Btru_044291 [Bulinus truncatus]